MISSTALKVGVIGCGAVAQIEWLPYLHELDEYCVTGISDISEYLVNYFGDLYNIPHRFTDWHKLIECPDVDAVIVLNLEHTDTCVYAANKGKDILVEKPLCENPEQAVLIEKTVQSNNVILMVGEMKSYDPGYQYGQKLIKNMKGLRMIRARMVCDALMHSLNEIYPVKRRPDVPESRREEMRKAFDKNLKAVTGELPPRLFNFFLGAGIHDVEIMRGVFGEPEGVEYCDIWDDGKMAVAYLKYGENVRASFEVGLTDQKWYEEELTAFGVDQTIRIIFPNPFLKNEPTVVEVIENDNGAFVEKKITASYDEAFRAQLKHFYKCVMNREKPLTDVLEGKSDVELMAAMFRSYANRILNVHGK
jgi:predicted dehydrogenase